MSTTNNIYQDNGYHSRKHYLATLAEDYGVDINSVNALADLLGPEEDFDGLVSMINDESERMMFAGEM